MAGIIPLIELVFAGSKVALPLISQLPELLVVAGAGASLAQHAGSGATPSTQPNAATSTSAVPTSAPPSGTTSVTPAEGTASSSSRATIRSQFPSLDYSHPSFDGLRDSTTIEELRMELKEGNGSMARHDAILQQEYAIIGRYLGLLPYIVQSDPVLQRLAWPAVTGRGEVLTEANASRLITPAVAEAANLLRAQGRSAMGPAAALTAQPILQNAFVEAKNQLEMKSEMQISNQTFAQRAAAAGIDPVRVQRVWSALQGRIADPETIKRVVAKWIYNKMLPGMAGAGVTWALNKLYSPGATPDGSVREYEETATRYELDRAFADLGLADTFSLDPDTTQPMEGSVSWTPNPVHGFGSMFQVMPRSSSVYPEVPAVGLPGKSIFGTAMVGDVLSEKFNDPRAKRQRTALNTFEMPDTLPSVPASDYQLHQNIQHTNTEPTPFGKIRAPHVVKQIPTLHPNVELGQRGITQNFDPTYSQGIPPAASGPTSARADDYIGANRGYRQTLDDAPNVVGMGYDTSQTERFLMDMVTSDESKLSSTQMAPSSESTQPNNSSAPGEGTPYGVSPADTKNPAFANVGTRMPGETQQPALMPRML